MPISRRVASTTYATPGRAPRRGLTLIELLLTIAVLGILAAALIPQLTSEMPERLDAAAQVVAADLDYTRALAVANNSTYQVVFEPALNRYYLRHSGANTLLAALPRSPFRQNDDAPDRQTTRLADLPLPEPGVRLVGAVVMQGSGEVAANVEFTALGGTATKYETIVWLAGGSGASERFISVHVNPVTGLTEIGPLQAGLPTAIATVLIPGASLPAGQP